MRCYYKAIETHYVGPTNTKGSRVIASDLDGNRVCLSWDSAINSDDNYYNAAMALMIKMGWPGTITGGSTKSGMVWVIS